MTESKIYNEKDRRPAMIPFTNTNPKSRLRFGLVASLVGLLIFIFGAAPGLFGLDRSPVIGFVQIAVFLVGLALISMGGYLALRAGWNGTDLTIRADIGIRLISTGYVVCVASGMADVFGFGSESAPGIPTFGIWQLRGVLAGQILIGIGFLLLVRWGKADTQEPAPEDGD